MIRFKMFWTHATLTKPFTVWNTLKNFTLKYMIHQRA